MLKHWATWPQGIRWLVGIGAVVLALAIAWALFVPAADWLAHHDVGSVRGSLRVTAVDDARGRLLTLGAGLFASGALIFTARNFTLSREGQVSERYTKAIEQLGSDKLDVRIGGIYALERVARDSARDQPTVMEVLTAFIREHSHDQWPPLDPGAEERKRSTRPDILAAFTVVGRRAVEHDIQPIDLHGAFLSGARLRAVDLRGARLRDAHVSGARRMRPRTAASIRARLRATEVRMRPRGAVLSGADLAHADLSGAHLSYVDLNGAHLSYADLSSVELFGADLTRANLTHANLTHANLTYANLSGANFSDADLSGASLGGANISGAYLGDADLSDVDLTHADFRGMDALGAYLTGAALAEQHMRGPVVPHGWELDTDTGRLKRADTDSRPTEAN